MHAPYEEYNGGASTYDGASMAKNKLQFPILFLERELQAGDQAAAVTSFNPHYRRLYTRS